MAGQPLPKLTPEQYLEIERKAEWKREYLNGEMFAMPGVSREHSLVNTNFTRELECSICCGRFLMSVLAVWWLPLKRRLLGSAE